MEEDMVKGMGYHCFDSIFFFFVSNFCLEDMKINNYNSNSLIIWNELSEEE